MAKRAALPAATRDRLLAAIADCRHALTREQRQLSVTDQSEVYAATRTLINAIDTYARILIGEPE